MDLATFIAAAIEKNGWSFRELERRAGDLDHAYIWRLAKGAQATPSLAAMEKLASALGLNERTAKAFALLAKGPIDDPLFELMTERLDIPWDDIEPVATMSFRGTRPSTQDDWLMLIEAVRKL